MEQDSKNAKAFPDVIKVFNLKTQQVVRYAGISSRKALVCAFAQFEKKDWNTWDYEQRGYATGIEEGKHTLLLGDWSVLKD